MESSFGSSAVDGSEIDGGVETFALRLKEVQDLFNDHLCGGQTATVLLVRSTAPGLDHLNDLLGNLVDEHLAHVSISLIEYLSHDIE